MKVYLLNPPFVKNYIRSSRCTFLPIAGSSWYPIFLAYATGLLEKHGHQVKFVDATVGDWNLTKVLTDIKDFQPDLTVIYISHDSFKGDINVTEYIKKLVKTKTIFVGPWAEPKQSEHPAVDMVISREFELPLLDLANGKPLKENGQFITDLDSLPFVSKVYTKHLDINLYRQSSLKHPFVDMFTARGCPWGKCTFCLWPQTIQKGAKYRTRSIKNVMAEIRFIREKTPVKEIFFQDDTMPASRMKELSEAIIGSGLKVTWSGYARADHTFTYEILKLAKKSGCRFLHIGFESGNQQILNNINKGVTRHEMEIFTKTAKKASIKLHSNFVFGLPGETKETMDETIKWAKKLRVSDYQFFAPQAHPGTKFYSWVKENGYLKDDKINYPHLTSKQIDEGIIKAYKRIYLSPSYILTQLNNSLFHPSEFIRLVKVAIKGVPKLFN